MIKGRISIEGDIATLIFNNGSRSTHPLSDLQKFYCLLVGSDVQANDSICYLLLFSNELWLIPELTLGSEDFRKWFDRINNEDKAVVATLDYLPFSWRSILLIFPGLEANLKILNRSEFNKIKDKLSINHNMTIDEVF